MGEDLGRPQSPNLLLDFSPFLLNPVNLEHKIGLSSFIHHNSNMVLANEAFPVDTSSELLPQWRQTTGVDEPQGWFYCLPRFRQATMPDLNTIIKDEAAGKSENCSGRERRFLVVDQSPDRTTLIFSSALQCLGSWRPKVDGINKSFEEDFIAEKRWINDFDGKEETDAEGVMEEDSEELDALLYSDSDDEEEERESEEEDEVTSTGHSPSTIMTSYDKECREEVASSYGPIRKRKAFDTHDIDGSFPQNNGEDDAESWCGGGRRDGELEEMVPKDGCKKKMRKERVEEITGILQSILPCSHGKEAVLVIDESIQYLKYLRISKPWL